MPACTEQKQFMWQHEGAEKSGKKVELFQTRLSVFSPQEALMPSLELLNQAALREGGLAFSFLTA